LGSVEMDVLPLIATSGI